MRRRSQVFFLLTLCMLFWFNLATAQNPERTKTVAISADSVYTKVLRALHESGYYIAQLDRPSGFIQSSVLLKDKSIIGFKEGEKRILNFLVSSHSDSTATIVLNIFRIERYRGGSFDSPNYYEEDKGLVQDDKIYQQMWNKILPLIH